MIFKDVAIVQNIFLKKFSSTMRFLVSQELHMTNFHAIYLRNPEYSNYTANIQQHILHNHKDNILHAWLLSKFFITYTQEIIINYNKVVVAHLRVKGSNNAGSKYFLPFSPTAL